ncbi:hypothetical protein HDU98_003123 [Podochytrium sp. JEL0797]|nr:hypothetical protein HDU98_003123 [Podochytrium sp. JEL0797]
MLSSTLLLALASTVFADFEMLSPYPRNKGTMAQQKIFPCSGPLTAPGDKRWNYASINDTIVLAFYWDGDNDIYLGTGENPQEFPYKIGALNGAKSGQTYSVPLDLSGVPADVLAFGAKLTIQAVCHQPGFDIYQCADVIYNVKGAETGANATATGTAVPSLQSASQVPSATISGSVAAPSTQLNNGAFASGVSVAAAVVLTLFL